jgi:RimJ/RimL family protein N-acetyltransferase
MDYPNRSVEIGNVMLGTSLQRTTAATEVFALLMHTAFEDMGARRLEWKCDNLHEGSKRAALRLGFTFEGVFRNHYIVKGRSRDTAWFSITQEDWPVIKSSIDAWLVSSNFDDQGRQKKRLEALRNLVVASK